MIGARERHWARTGSVEIQTAARLEEWKNWTRFVHSRRTATRQCNSKRRLYLHFKSVCVCEGVLRFFSYSFSCPVFVRDQLIGRYAAKSTWLHDKIKFVAIVFFHVTASSVLISFSWIELFYRKNETMAPKFQTRRQCTHAHIRFIYSYSSKWGNQVNQVRGPGLWRGSEPRVVRVIRIQRAGY